MGLMALSDLLRDDVHDELAALRPHLRLVGSSDGEPSRRACQELARIERRPKVMLASWLGCGLAAFFALAVTMVELAN
jgi:hypothetical protein